MQIFNRLHTDFVQQFGPAGHVPPLPWDGIDDDESGDAFYDNVLPEDLPLPVSFPLGDDAD